MQKCRLLKQLSNYFADYKAIFFHLQFISIFIYNLFNLKNIILNLFILATHFIVFILFIFIYIHFLFFVSKICQI